MRKRDEHETTVATMAESALRALELLGGRGSEREVIDRVGNLLEGQLDPSDHARLYTTPEGKEDYAPSDYADETWPVWRSKCWTALKRLRQEGYLHRDQETFLMLTENGRRWLALLAERRYHQAQLAALDEQLAQFQLWTM